VEDVRNVVAGLDERADPHVVDVARALVAATGADLAFAHAVDADPEMAQHPQSWGILPERWEAAVADVRARVFAPARGVVPAAEVLRFGSPAGVLRSVARELHAEIVVVGRRGRSGRGPHHPWSVAATLAAHGPFATLIA
jgi:nucleotide-binding universal stress UspA family protein